jgi:hypothetical protein
VCWLLNFGKQVEQYRRSGSVRIRPHSRQALLGPSMAWRRTSRNLSSWLPNPCPGTSWSLFLEHGCLPRRPWLGLASTLRPRGNPLPGRQNRCITSRQEYFPPSPTPEAETRSLRGCSEGGRRFAPLSPNPSDEGRPFCTQTDDVAAILYTAVIASPIQALSSCPIVAFDGGRSARRRAPVRSTSRITRRRFRPAIFKRSSSR